MQQDQMKNHQYIYQPNVDFLLSCKMKTKWKNIRNRRTETRWKLLIMWWLS
jgi:hypothetical protein